MVLKAFNNYLLLTDSQAQIATAGKHENQNILPEMSTNQLVPYFVASKLGTCIQLIRSYGNIEHLFAALNNGNSTETQGACMATLNNDGRITLQEL